MDSEDERDLEEPFIVRGIDTRGLWKRVFARLFERDERDELREAVFTALVRPNSPEYEDPQSRGESIRATYRYMRFFESIEGFHTGELDLSGRHEYRYKSLIKRWTAITQELDDIRNHIHETFGVYLGPDGEPDVGDDDNITYSRIKISVDEAPKAVFQFMERWHVDYPDLVQCYYYRVRLRALMKSQPEPIFQRILLQDLPPEVLYYVVKFAGRKSGRELGATCRFFYNVCSRHIYEHCHLSLRCDIMDADDREFYGVGAESVRKRAQVAQAKLQEHISFLRTRPDIVERIGSLVIDNRWNEESLAAAEWNNPAARGKFFVPLYQELSTSLSPMTNLRSLLLNDVFIIAKFARVILALPRLHTLELVQCKVAMKAETLASLAPSSSIQHLAQSLSDARDATSWRLLPSLPNVRWMEVHRTGTQGSALPSAAILEQTNPFALVERVYLNGIAYRDVPKVSELLRAASPPHGSGPRLTHFKLELGYGLEREDLFDLISALSLAPVQYLVLEGINYAGTDLFDRIAQAFPQLISLVLMYRESGRQYITRQARWPHTTGEYARCFTGFQNLQYFAWNMRLWEEGSPLIMTRFEEGWPEDPQDQDEFDEDLDEDPFFSVDDWFCVPKVFAQYCSTLKSLSIICGESLMRSMDLEIDRSPEGRVEVSCSFNKIAVDFVLAPRRDAVPLVHPHNPEKDRTSWPKFVT